MAHEGDASDAPAASDDALSTDDSSAVAAAARAQVADLFDNEVLWDADDTDEFVLQLFRDLEAAGVRLASAKDQGWNSLLHMAALWNRRVIMEALVRRGAELNAKNKNGHTPLDLASHWGHFDLALQLQHYGGKHTCESERDVAIAQRDLAQQRNRECEAEMNDALERLKCAKQEREEFRVERDRLFQLHSDVVQACNAQAAQLQVLETTVSELTTEKHVLRIRAAQLTDELRCEQAARSNAVQGWKIAEQVIADMQQRHEECREREEEALAMRNEALDERDTARELTRLAQLDQGIAKQQQVAAERERDRALQQLLAAESDIARDKEVWRAKAAKIELERRNIQIEIDRQTELLRCENTKLEKQLAALTATNTRQRHELGDMSAALVNAQKQSLVLQRELSAASGRVVSLEDHVRILEDEKREDHRAWRERMEQTLQRAIAHELRAMLDAAVVTWRKLYDCQERVHAFDVAALAAMFQSSSSSSSSESASVLGAGSLMRQTSGTTSTPALKTGRLPVLQDKSNSGLRDTSVSTTPRAAHVLVSAAGNNVPGFVTHNCTWC